MKKFAISLLALAAVSTAALADEFRYSPRDSDAFSIKQSHQLTDQSTKAFAVNNDVQALNAFELMVKRDMVEGNNDRSDR
jgi:hypothetical protein